MSTRSCFSRARGQCTVPSGGAGGGPFTVDFHGKTLHYLFGRSGDDIDQIGFGYGDPPQPLPSPVVRSMGHGGTGGGAFDDLNSLGNQLGKIKSITVRHVDSIAVTYGPATRSSHGGGGGGEDRFDLEDDEWLTEIRGRSGLYLDQVQFFLSSGRVSPVYGGYGGGPFIERRDNSIIKAFFGRSGLYIDQLGVYFANRVPH